jgi:signal transduction histidine kinase
MRQYLLVVVWLFLYPLHAAAQGNARAKDSLQAVAASAVHDTLRAQAFDKLGKLTEAGNIDSAITYYEAAYAISEQQQYQTGILRYHHRMAYALALKGAHDEALAEALTYTRLARSYGNPREETKSYIETGIVYEMRAEPDKAITAYKTGIAMAEAGNYEKELIDAYGNLTVLYARQKLLDEALALQHKCIAFNKARNSAADLLYDYVNLAAIYNDLPLPDSAFYYARLGLQYAKQQQNNMAIAQIEHNLVLSFIDAGQKDSARYYAQRARQSAIALGHVPGILRTTVTLGYALHTAGEYADAMRYMDSARVLLSAAGNQKQELFYYYETLYGMYKERGDYKAALDAYERFRSIKDSVVNGENQRTLLQYREATEQAGINRKMLEKELHISRQRTLLWILVIALGGLLLSGFIYYGYLRKKHEARKQAITALQKEQELVAARALLEGQQTERARISKEIHDELGSSLTSISLLTEVLKKRIDAQQHPEVMRISVTSAETIDKMNEIVWALNTRNDTVNSLVAYIRKFAGNFLHDAGIQLEYEEEVQPDDRPIEGVVRRNIYLTVKEAIHNIIKHASARKVKLAIHAVNDLRISIADNGRGITAGKGAGFGNGLRNMQMRMEDIGGKLEVESSEGTIVRLWYPSA